MRKCTPIFRKRMRRLMILTHKSEILRRVSPEMRNLSLMFKNLQSKAKKVLTKVGAFIEASIEVVGEVVDDIPDLDFD